VHAAGQVVSFTTESRLPPDRWVKALNAHLPPTIAVRRAAEVPDSFHARYSATTREYRYTILNRPTRPAIGRQYAWWIPQMLDAEAMHRAAQVLLGSHDFSAFAGSSPRSSSIRTVLVASVSTHPDHVIIDLAANAFLLHMVRNVVGTLAQIGKGCLEASELATILASCDRSRAAATAPPHGLCLVRVNYGDAPL
jgi:tRNA pseudouridine38-40 synthase